MAEKTIEQKANFCEKVEGLPIPLDILGKKIGACSSPEIQEELAKRKQGKKNLVQDGSRALKGEDGRAQALLDATNG